jgi:transposase
VKLPSIDGREIVPVRQIPFICKILDPDTLTKILAHRQNPGGMDIDPDQMIQVSVEGVLTEIPKSKLIDVYSKVRELYAYSLLDDGKPAKMLAIEWDSFVLRINL